MTPAQQTRISQATAKVDALLTQRFSTNAPLDDAELDEALKAELAAYEAAGVEPPVIYRDPE